MTEKILFLISDMQAGGAQRVASLLCNEWSTKDYIVTLCTLDNQTSFYALDQNIKIMPLDLLKPSKNFLTAQINNIRRVIALRTIIKSQQPDYIIAFQSEMNILAILAAKSCGKIITVGERSDPNQIPSSKIWRFLRKITYPFANDVVCQTPDAADFFSNRVKTRILANPLPPDLTEQAKEPLPETITLPKNFIAGLGRLSPEKGFDLLITAFAEIGSDYPDTHLVLIGDGPERKTLERLIVNHNLQSRVLITGYVPNPAPILSRATIFALPSRFEGFPNALAEAMALSIPSLASSGAIGAKALIKNNHNGILYTPENPDALKNALSNLLCNKKERERLGTNANQLHKTLQISSIAREWLKRG